MPTKTLQHIGLDQVKGNWGWYVALGVILILLGSTAIGRTYLLTAVSVIFFGWLMIAGGTMQCIYAFWKERGWSGFFIDLLGGILYVVVGFMVVANPASTAIALTLLIAMFLIFSGAFRIGAAISVRQPNWGWVLLHGAASLLLGIMIWRQWPLSGVWVIGLFVGIEMIFNGWSLVMLGLVAKKLPVQAEDTAAATS